MTTAVSLDRTCGAAVRGRAAAGMRANFLWVSIANVVYLASQWLVVTAVARLTSAEMVGQLSLGFAIAAPIFLLGNLRLRTVLATDANREYAMGDYLSVRVVTTLASLALVAGLCCIYPMPGQTALVVVCVALAKSFESGSDLFYGLFQQCDQTNRMTVSILLRGIASVLAVAVVCHFRPNAAAAAMTLCVISAVLLLVCDIPLASDTCRRSFGAGLRLRWRRPALRRLAGAAVPLGVSAMLMSLGVNAPRYFIEKVAGTRAVGLFSAVFYVAMAGGYAVSALAEGASPKLASLYAFGTEADFRQVLRRLVGLAVAVGIGTLLVFLAAGKPILNAIYGAEYQASWSLLMWLAGAAVLANTASILSYGMIAVRRYRDQLLSLIAMTAVTALSCAILVPSLGLRGAAMALMVGYAVQTGWGVLAIRQAKSPRCA